MILDGNRDQDWELYAASSKPELYQYQVNQMPDSLGSAGSPIAATDGNHDGYLEIYAASGNTTTGQGLDEWSYNAATWTSSPVKPVTTGLVFTGLAAGDGDNDPDQDDELYAAWRVGDSESFYQYKFDGDSWNENSITNPGTGEILSLVLGDIDQNGQNELYVANADGKIYRMICNNPGWSSIPVNPDNNVICNQITVADGDNDGQDEIYGAGADGHAWQFKYSDGVWQSPLDLGYSGTTLNAIAVGDGDNNFQNEVYALGADGFVYQYKMDAMSPTPTPTPTATPTASDPIAGMPTDFKGKIIDSKYFYVYPNPTRDVTVRFRFFLRQTANVKVGVYTFSGEKVWTREQHYNQGWNEFVWDSSGVANGGYIYLVTASDGGLSETLRKKIGLIR